MDATTIDMMWIDDFDDDDDDDDDYDIVNVVDEDEDVDIDGMVVVVAVAADVKVIRTSHLVATYIDHMIRWCRNWWSTFHDDTMIWSAIHSTFVDDRGWNHGKTWHENCHHMAVEFG